MILYQFIGMFVFDMARYIKAEVTKETLGENPFISTLEILVNSVKSNDKYKVHDKELGDEAVFELANFDYESLSYCKLFADATRRLKMVELSPRAKDLLLWVMYEIKPGKDWLHLNKERYMDENKIGSINTYRDALNDLIRKKFLGKTIVSGVYWINPDYIFNGSRIKAFPDNIKKRK